MDWSLMEQWRREGPARASGVTPERFEDAPDRDIEEYCRLYSEVANQAPAGDLPGAMTVTPEQRRQEERELASNGYEWHTLISREPDGTISGLTEMFYAPAEPRRLEQELIGVKAGYRGRGVGKWLKAEMLAFVAQSFPQAIFVNTGNADQNGPIVSITSAWGFARYWRSSFSSSTWRTWPAG